MKLSALILTKNEQEMIEGCLEQLSFADEIIILDQNSIDLTVKIAQKYTDKIFSTKDSDFAKNRSKLRELAKGEWLLYLDADERLSQEATLEIEKIIKNGAFAAYFFPRKNYFFGKWLKHGGWWPDYVPRLFKKDKLLSWNGEIHESPKIEGESKTLETPIEHNTARSLSQMFQKSIKWAKIEAELFNKSNKKAVTPQRVIKATFFEFTKRYVFKLGFLDGTVGLIEALYQGLHQAIILTYLWELQNNTKSRPKYE